ncbi:hypothetical protein MG293_014915 [Ovis ammon polii]|uniref:Uncharacterized protein n=1 Tax=Ovis ammon polii TaxID=230172 RepID=A0AAD4Y1A7_OVIAM|nr:hypothetical protein MG293_014915 [Ovis ammon polii]
MGNATERPTEESCLHTCLLLGVPSPEVTSPIQGLEELPPLDLPSPEDPRVSLSAVDSDAKAPPVEAVLRVLGDMWVQSGDPVSLPGQMKGPENSFPVEFMYFIKDLKRHKCPTVASDNEAKESV